MTPQDLLQDLRDIHLPPDAPAVAGTEIALWPIVGLALLLGTLATLGLWRRGAWRREARIRLAAIDHLDDLARQWAQLLELAVEITRRSGRRVPLPDTLYRDPGSLGRAEVEGLRHQLRAALRK